LPPRGEALSKEGIAMEMNEFDILMRQLSGTGSSRRQALQALGTVLLGSAFGGVAARLGLADGTAAKPKKHKHKPKPKRPSQAARKTQGQLQAEGKGKKKGKGKGKGKGKPKPPPRPPCGTGMVQCPDKSCVAADACCPGDYQCPDGSCIPVYECCPPDRSCGDLTCVGPGECCPSEKSCPFEGCIPESECCQSTAPLCTECQEEYCNDGTWTCIPKETPNCGACEEMVCDNGTWICRPKPSLDTCQQCPDGYKWCEEGEPCIPENECCGTTEFVCANCYSLACENGAYVCIKDWVTGCNCPWGASVCPNAPGRSWPLPEGGSIDLPPGCCPPGHFGWEHPSGEAKCFEELLGSGSSEAGWICFEGW
jgi:hypothetical protein